MEGKSAMDSKVSLEDLAERALSIAQRLARSMPDTPAANRLRVWIGDGDGTPPFLEVQRARWEMEVLSGVALGQEKSWWLRMESTRGGGNGPALAEFSKSCMGLWRDAPGPESAKRLVELCADAAWRACAARFYARRPCPEGEELLGRAEGLAIQSASVFEPRMSLTGLKKTLVAAMATPWMADPASLGLSAGACKEQGDAFREACAAGLSGAYRAWAGPGGEPAGNPLSAWRESGFGEGKPGELPRAGATRPRP